MERKQLANALLAVGVFATAFALYTATMARGLVFGDPAEYTFVPHIWGIAHPPGYAFQTVLGGIWQRIVPVGSVAFRANLLSVAAGSAIATLAYGVVRTLDERLAPALLAAGSAITATAIWQHSLHANAHIVTALLATLSLFLLVRWWRAGGEVKGQADGWLWTFCVVAGLSVTHHPLLVFSFPAYTAFILTVRPGILFQPTWRVLFVSPRALVDSKQWQLILRNPRILAEWDTLLKMVGFGLLGLCVWLYLPLRNLLPAPLPFGPENTATLNGFLDLVLARGLTVNLFHFGLSEQPQRLLVLWTMLRLQAGLIVIALMAAGFVWLWAKHWRVGLLFTLFLGVNIAFIINTIQDVLAYLLTPFAALMMLAGVGVIALSDGLERMALPALARAVLPFLLLTIPVLRGVQWAPRVSLAGYDDAARWVEEARTEADGGHLLAHWEHLTPLWYTAWVADDPLEGAELVFVAANSPTPWLDNTRRYIEQGPVYVSGYQRDLVENGFRLHPMGEQVYEVLPAGEGTDTPQMGISLDARAGDVTLLGANVPYTELQPGDKLHISLAMMVDEPTEAVYFPYATLGDVLYDFTTDSHLLSPSWLAGEPIVERYDVYIPPDMPAGDYPLRVAIRNLTTGETPTFEGGEETVELAVITVSGEPQPHPEALLANIAQQVGLTDVRVSAAGERRSGLWQEPITAAPGEAIRLRLNWLALDHPDENWKVFVHLIDANERVVAQVDAPPLGGAFPTFLWFPKWVPGQQIIDPYVLHIPEGAPPGTYRIQVGMYGFNTLQRARFYDEDGNLSGDRLILGPVVIQGSR